MVRAFSGSASATKARVGVNLVPAARPTAERRMPLALSSPAAALARDLGAGLGVGGHLTALRRTRVGPYKLDAAKTLEQLQEELTVMPVAEAASAAFPRWDVDEKRARLLLNGVRLEMPAYPPGTPASPGGRR